MTKTTDPQQMAPALSAAGPSAASSSVQACAATVPVTSPPLLPDDTVVEARNSLTLRCGKSSITLHANGKIVLRGEYILSDAEGINRIAGGQIELN